MSAELDCFCNIFSDLQSAAGGMEQLTSALAQAAGSSSIDVTALLQQGLVGAGNQEALEGLAESLGFDSAEEMQQVVSGLQQAGAGDMFADFLDAE